jgi:hypothetical protein
MKTLKEQDYIINICTDIIEWAKEFYNMPDGAELTNEDEVSSECMGFADSVGKIVWVFVPVGYKLRDLKEIIAHEIGHIIEMQYPTNPEPIEANDELQEMKANHYMNFFLLVDYIVADVVDVLEGI